MWQSECRGWNLNSERYLQFLEDDEDFIPDECIYLDVLLLVNNPYSKRVFDHVQKIFYRRWN